MPMTQEDIHRHYQAHWQQQADGADAVADLRYSDPVEDAIIYPVYENLIADLGIRVNGGRVLDVGCGAGRWIRFFLERYQPAALVGVDFARSSSELLERWCDKCQTTELGFCTGNIADPDFALEGPFDLINVANVLFHIPEHELFTQALHNLSRLVGPAGHIVTTEYLPRVNMRTEWMLVRSRYAFEAAVASAGLRIIDIRASSFFSNDPMGIDGPDNGVRAHFGNVRAGMQQIHDSKLDAQSKQFLVNFMVEVERAMLAFCKERLAAIDMPSQKLVVLAPAKTGH